MKQKIITFFILSALLLGMFQSTTTSRAQSEIASLDQVEDISFSIMEDDIIRVHWEAVSGATSYEIYRSSTPDGTYELLGRSDTTEYTISDVKTGELWYVSIRAINANEISENSDPIVIALRPAAVSTLAATGSTKNSISISWEPVEHATGYTVYYRLANNTEFSKAESTEKTIYTLSSLSTSEDYVLMVRAYTGTEDNEGSDSNLITASTTPATPIISNIRGGDKRIKLYWNATSGADRYRILISTSKEGPFETIGTAELDEARVKSFSVPLLNYTYYAKIEAVHTSLATGEELVASSAIVSAKTKKATDTSTKAKKYKNKKAFKKSNAYKNYKFFQKTFVYGKSFIVPGLITTNVAGFNSTHMVPQAIAFWDKYLFISAYDYTKQCESVIYIMNKDTRKYITTLVLPHKGHVGGIASDGTYLWIAYGKSMQALRLSEIQTAVLLGDKFTEITRFAATCPTTETVSYIAYYKNHLWAGVYNELSSRNMYGYTVETKDGVPSLTKTNQMKMPNRTQGVAFTNSGKMLVSRSCQTNSTRRGFLSVIDTYKPTWDFSKTVILKNSRTKTKQMPPMNEGIAISGSYLYVIYESTFSAECKAPIDRVTALKKML